MCGMNQPQTRQPDYRFWVWNEFIKDHPIRAVVGGLIIAIPAAAAVIVSSKAYVGGIVAGVLFILMMEFLTREH